MADMYFTGPGWWKMLDHELKKFYDIDPELHNVEVKEKYGTAQIDYAIGSQDNFDALIEQEKALDEISAHTCEICGKHGKMRSTRGWLQCLCERCYAADFMERRKIGGETLADYRATTDWAVQSLSELPLTERDKVYLRYAAYHPDEMDKIVEQIIQSHRAT